jgi:hypothetical protein
MPPLVLTVTVKSLGMSRGSEEQADAKKAASNAMLRKTAFIIRPL